MRYKLACNIAAIAAVVLIFSVTLGWFERQTFVFGGFLYMALTLALYALLMYTSRVFWFTLPLAWFICLIPNYYYSYHVIPGGFFGHAFTFQVLAVLFIAPPFILSLVLPVGRLIVLRLKRRRAAKITNV